MDPRLYRHIGSLVVIEKYGEALDVINKVIAVSENNPELHHGLGELYGARGSLSFFCGRMKEAWENYGKDFAITNYYCDNGISERLGITILREQTVGRRIGEFTKQMDLLIKASKLGLRKDRPQILLKKGYFSLHNNALLKYWEKYITLFDDEKLIDMTGKAARESVSTVYAPTKSGLTIESDFAWMDVQKEWEAQGRRPLLEISEEDEDRGATAMAGLGVPHDGWFVCLHCRENSLHDRYPNNRSADINTYLPAINEVVRNGGWVVRIGDPSMSRLKEMKNVIDYAHHPKRCDRLDLYIIAKCRFMISTPSGPCAVAAAFGTPQIHTNVYPFIARPWCKHDLFLPMLQQDIKTGELLSFKEQLRAFSICEQEHRLAAFGRRVIRNSEEELKDGVNEMIDFVIHGGQNESARTMELREKFDSVHLELFPTVTGKIGVGFIDKYARLLN
ncbi:MAG: hypothetical protein A3G18_04275 [Rhodospirillales bacterium RIFCSPLOWO2_12_FULL_58_28]|nr:MAG: hypothetical protein A3H92_05155 [Rhodospirillales bacterium RIFCSPLOWO2_02_FULL_58_16]OHC78732.1 MAG: hypothetical protein A3G18_04275 [Rhodospirillales bacterium RIFCSPLOWO2_12_FULL_58_28]